MSKRHRCVEEACSEVFGGSAWRYLFVAMDKHGDERLLIFGCKAGSRVEPIGRMLAERMVCRWESHGLGLRA